MGKWKRLLCLGSVVLLAGCGTAEKRKVSAPVPVPPPAIQALPLGSSDSLLRALPPPLPDAVDLLIDQVEALYKAGMDDYRSGNLEKAKEEFDRAVALLLSSNFDIQGDDRLSAEFDKRVEDIYSAEAAALERGETWRAHNYEPAPIESFAGLTFPVDPKVKERAREELKYVRSDLPLVSNDYVDGVLTYFQNRGRGFIDLVLKRVGLYQPIIVETLRKEGLPQELIYLAAAESGFNCFALSRAGAKGIWQFILSRGMEYGLKKNRWVDEREDPVKSTQAAARHLKDLYQEFGDWYLAMAAYNCGPVTVQKAIEKTGYADFWSLRRLHALPVDTENYVPIILATVVIAKDPQAYGFQTQPDPSLEWDQSVVSIPTDLRLVAQLIDRPVEELIKLNPSLLRWTTPPDDPEFALNLPSGTKETFERNIASIPPDKRIWWRAYKVEGGETVASIAKKFHVSPVALAEVNQLSRDAALERGAHLVLPLAPGKESSLVRVRERGPRRAVSYRVRPGDTLELIADRFDVTPYEIRRWNRLKTSKLVPGKALRVYIAVGSGRGARASRSRARRRTARSSPTGKETQSTKSTSGRKESGSSSKISPSGHDAAR